MSTIRMYLDEMYLGGHIVFFSQAEKPTTRFLPACTLSSAAGMAGRPEKGRESDPAVVVDILSPLVQEYFRLFDDYDYGTGWYDLEPNVVPVRTTSNRRNKCRRCRKEIPDQFCISCGIIG